MHQLMQVELDFQCHSTTMAQWFNAAGEQLFVDELLPLAQQVLDEFDTGMAVRLDEIQLQLPPLHLPADRYVLQHCFREALREQLWLLLPAAVPLQEVMKQPGLTAAQQQHDRAHDAQQRRYRPPARTSNGGVPSHLRPEGQGDQDVDAHPQGQQGGQVKQHGWCTGPT